MRANFGANYAAMRKARVDIVDLTSGQRRRVPIVDVGLSPEALAKGTVVDMTRVNRQYFGGISST